MKKWKVTSVLILVVLVASSGSRGATSNSSVSHLSVSSIDTRITSPIAPSEMVLGSQFLKTLLHPNVATTESAALSGQSVTLMPNGQLLMLGGLRDGQPLETALIKDPKTGFTAQISKGLTRARYGHTATVLPNGKVLIAGGIGSGRTAEKSLEIFDPATSTFTPITDALISSRAFHSATLLTDGRVLIAGGFSSESEILGSIEFYDFRTSTTKVSDSSLLSPRAAHAARLQADGTVLFSGGFDFTEKKVDLFEVFDPLSESVRPQTNSSVYVSSGIPLVEASIPQDGMREVPVDANIVLRFSRELDVKTITRKTMTLEGPGGFVPVKVTAAEAGVLAFATPVKNLLPTKEYVLTMSGAADPSGTTVPDTRIAFTTASDSPDNKAGAPEIISSSSSTPNPFETSWRELPALRAAPGITAIAGQALKLSGEPLPNLSVQIGGKSARTDETGRFLLKNVPTQHQVMLIDGGTANKSGTVYGVFEVGVEISGGQTNVLGYTIWMTPLDVAHSTVISSPTVKETKISSPSIPGLELRIPAATTISDHQNKGISQLNITAIPVSQPPFPLPPGISVSLDFTIQPGGTNLKHDEKANGSIGGQIIFPNTQHKSPGTRLDIWTYDPHKRGWYINGKGTVDPTGTQIVPDDNVAVSELSSSVFSDYCEQPSVGPVHGGVLDGDPVDLQTGLFPYAKTDLALPDTIPIELTRTYRQLDSLSRSFGIGTSINYDMFIVDDSWATAYIDVVLADGATVQFDRVTSGTDRASAVYKNLSSPTEFYGAQITPISNGYALTMKTGTQFLFFGQVSTSIGARSLGQIIDRYGNTVTLTRDSNTNLIQITSPNGRWIKLTRDASSRITQATDNIGRTVVYTYDSTGHLWTVKDPNNGVTTFTYDSQHNMTSIQDARGIQYLTNYYDINNRVSKQVLADGGTYQFTYKTGISLCLGPCAVSGSSIVETDVTNPRGFVRKVLFNTDGYAVADTRAVGTPEQQVITYERQPSSGLILGTTDALNRRSTYTYDANGNVTSATYLAGTTNASTVTMTYEPKFNQISSFKDPLGHVTFYSHDNYGSAVRVSDPLGNSTDLSYDSSGRPTLIVDSGGASTQFGYSGPDLVTVSGPSNYLSTRILDGAGRVISATDPSGTTTQYAYNPLNLITSAIDPLGTTGFTWDPNGNLSSITDAMGSTHTTSYSYDPMDRIASRKDPLLVEEKYDYDVNGNLKQFTDRRTKVSTFQYDGLDRLTFAGFGMTSGTTYESTINFTFDAGSRLRNLVDSSSGTIVQDFDGFDRLTSQTTPQGNVSYQYDAAGRRSTMTVAGQPVVSYTFDDADRLTQILKGTDVVHFVYDNSGRRTSTTLPNGTLATYLYDLSSRLTGINYQRGGSTLGDLTYQYDGAGRRSSMTGSFASVNLPSAIPSATYNANNQLTNWNGTERTYDPNGNLINDGTRTYAWNARNQLSSVGAFEFQYDGFGRRIGNGAGLNFLYDGVNPIQELAGGVPSANMLSGGVDEVFLRSGINGNWNLLSNGLGSTLGLSDTGGNVQTQYTYEPFGKTTITGTPNANSIQFTGRELDADGLYYYRARYYDPAIGRFLSEDPIRFDGGNNFYVYAQNNPIELTDPFGLKCKPKCFAQLKYRRAKFGENHSFWWVQDSNGDQWVISGGPTEVFGAPGTGYLNVWVVPGSTGHYPADNAGAAVAFDSGLSEQVCRQVDQMLQHARQWPNNQIYYGSNNSNTVAHDIGNAGSFNPPQPPRTPGW